LGDGRRGEILLKETNGPGGACVFVGQGVFPVMSLNYLDRFD